MTYNYHPDDCDYDEFFNSDQKIADHHLKSTKDQMAKPTGKTITTILTTKNFELKLNNKNLVNILHEAGHSEIPRDAKIYVTVPGGGDWSHADLELSDYPLIISWSVTQEERRESLIPHLQKGNERHE